MTDSNRFPSREGEVGEGTSINIFSGTWQDNAANYAANCQNYNPTFNPLEKVIELYERLLKAEKEKVAMLQEIIQGKSKTE